MKELSREGHRERMRRQFLSGDMDHAPEHNLLELFLSLIIPRRDVKPLSYDLINTFGSLKGVFQASEDELYAVKGLGETSVTAIKLVSRINSEILRSENKRVQRLITLDDAERFFINELSFEPVEKMMLVTLRNDGSIINKSIISEGTVNMSVVDLKTIAQYVSDEKCSSVYIAHNHPDGFPVASGADISFTINLRDFLRKMYVDLNEHFVVAGGECQCILKDIVHLLAEENKNDSHE